MDEVRRFFREFGPAVRAGVYEQVAVELARVVESGGSAGIAAGKELLSVIDSALIKFPLCDEDEDEDEDG